MKIKHALKNLIFGQIDKYNCIDVEFEIDKSKIIVKKMASTCTVSNRKGEITVFVN